jgi:hypothetical protein
MERAYLIHKPPALHVLSIQAQCIPLPPIFKLRHEKTLSWFSRLSGGPLYRLALLEVLLLKASTLSARPFLA